MSPLRILRQIITPTGQHRAVAPAGPAVLFPAAPFRPVVTQAFRYCPPCGTTTAAVLHRDGHTCGDCGTTHYPEDGAE
ncbi:hypothetical protein ACWGDS_25830 [Streptomyces sp. NPDC055059]